LGLFPWLLYDPIALLSSSIGIVDIVLEFALSRACVEEASIGLAPFRWYSDVPSSSVDVVELSEATEPAVDRNICAIVGAGAAADDDVRTLFPPLYGLFMRPDGEWPPSNIGARRGDADVRCFFSIVAAAAFEPEDLVVAPVRWKLSSIPGRLYTRQREISCYTCVDRN
jgi:hypothetical protein